MSYNGFNENVTILTGRAVKDSEHKKVGTSDLCSFRIVHNKRMKKRNSDEYTEKSCYIDCETWGKRAEYASKYVKKGKMVRVMAELEQDEWKDKDGNNKQKHKLYVYDVQVERDARPSSDGQSGAAPQPAAVGADDSGANQDLPF